tara:strand:+ start:104 stop:655 length:552 start_codon:yes stop_codon:yes gene_type:complete
MPFNSLLTHKTLADSRGFTLIEIIVGIVVLSISLSIISTLIVPAEQKSADQILQVKAAELGQSFLNDISSRAFADNSDMTGGKIRCGEPDDGSNICTEPLGLDGSEGSSRADYNDVDDFHGYKIKDDLVDPLDSTYDNFIVEVDVIYAGSDLGLADKLAKRITVTITTPLGTEIKFATHKANF